MRPQLTAERPLLRFAVSLLALLAVALCPVPRASAQTHAHSLKLHAVDIGGGVTLHYVEAGSGTPVVFVHGSLSDYSYWDTQVAAFSKHHRAIAYSRRYNYPNLNPPSNGYSAITDADDLAALIERLHLGRVYLVGHSYGALTALFLATKHPELLRAVVLAEPPAVSLLRHMPDEQAAIGQSLFEDIQHRMVEPMQMEFAKGNRNAGVGVFIDYVFNDPTAWARMAASDRAQTLRDAHEWDIMMTGGTFFPDLSPTAIRAIDVPVLVMSGGKSYRFLGYIDQELVRLIPRSRSIVYPDAGHQMWYQEPVLCRQDAEAFFNGH